MNSIITLTLVPKSLLCLGNFYLLFIRQDLGWLPIGHEFESINATDGPSEGNDENGGLTHHDIDVYLYCIVGCNERGQWMTPLGRSQQARNNTSARGAST
eukprot:scaffold24_cov186-Alexandrium_tamarense.AAC.6